MSLQPWKQTVIFLVGVCLVGMACAFPSTLLQSTATPSPLPPTNAPQSFSGTPSGPCDPQTVNTLQQAVSHEWAAQGATQVALLALNEALFTCYFGSRGTPCDITGLSVLQLTLSQEEANGQTPPVDAQIAYANALAVCMGQRPPEPTVTPAAGAASVQPTPVGCDEIYADWVLSGEPYLTTNDQLVAFYTRLLQCNAVKPVVSPCDLIGLAQVHLDLRAAAGLNITSDTLQKYEPVVLGCFGTSPALLAGFSALVASNGGSNGVGTGSGVNQAGPALPPSNPVAPAATATPPPLPNPGGPYVVKQIETLGHESISGVVCSLTKPFVVNATAPKAAWAFLFVPQDATHGNVSYTYNIPSAGESHDAKGTYTISPPDHDGTLHLSLTVSDHVVFKGFDGNIPNRYKFDLVPTEGATCP